MAADNEDIWANDADIVTLFFPAHSTFSSVTTANETIPALGEAYRCTIDLSASLGSDEGDRRTKDSYWRCLGVPSFEDPSGVSGFAYLYEWNKSDNSLHVVSSAGFDFEPSHAYLVQSDQEIVWTDAVKPASVIARQKAKGTDKEFRIELQYGTAICDQIFFSF